MKNQNMRLSFIFSEDSENSTFLHHLRNRLVKNYSLSRHLSRLILFMFFFFQGHECLVAQVKVCSWNVQHLGKTKSAAEINFMANTLKLFDVVALQEVVAGYGGSQAIARLAGALNKKGEKWDYVISDPTNSSPYATERYAYLWKSSKVEGIRKAWLEQKFEEEIDREPFFMDFFYEGKSFTLVNFHAIPKKKQPETEIKYFKYFLKIFSEKNLVFLGDFNVPQSHTVFNPLKKEGYKPALVDQKTTMKMKCTSITCLASEYDNIFFHSSQITYLDSGVIHIYKSFPDMVSVRRISDHIPVWMEFDLPSIEADLPAINTNI